MSEPVTINIGLCGFGTVGQGVWKHLSANRAELESRLGVKLNLARAAVREAVGLCARHPAVFAFSVTLPNVGLASVSAAFSPCHETVGSAVTLARLNDAPDIGTVRAPA